MGEKKDGAQLPELFGKDKAEQLRKAFHGEPREYICHQRGMGEIIRRYEEHLNGRRPRRRIIIIEW